MIKRRRPIPLVDLCSSTHAATLLIILVLSTAFSGFQTLHAAIRTWDGGGANTAWSNSTNWVNDIAPVAGDTLEFGAGPTQRSTLNDFPPGTLFHAITLSGFGYSLAGSTVALEAGIVSTASASDNRISLPLALTASQSFVVSNAAPIGNGLFLNGSSIDTAGHELTLNTAGAFVYLQARVTGAGSITKLGSGTLSLYASNSYSGPTHIVAGRVSLEEDVATLGDTNGETVVEAGATVTLTSGTIIVREPLQLAGTLFSVFGQPTWAGPIALTATSATVRAGAANSGLLTISGTISGTGFTKTDAGAVLLTADNTYTNSTVVSQGMLVVNGVQPASALQLAFGTLAGIGTVGPIGVSGSFGKSIAPGFNAPGILRAGSISLDSVSFVSLQLNGTTPGAGHDQLDVSGTVNLANAQLQTSFGIMPGTGDRFVIINNDSSDPVVGTFQGLPEGASLTNGSVVVRITYIGGDGNDVVLFTGAAASRITSLICLTNGFKQIQGLGEAGLTYGIEAATNLNLPIIWTPIGTDAADSSGLYEFVDTNAPLHPSRFYRVKSP